MTDCKDKTKGMIEPDIYIFVHALDGAVLGLDKDIEPHETYVLSTPGHIEIVIGPEEECIKNVYSTSIN